MSRATKRNPRLWDRIVSKYKRSSKGGKKGSWSARKAQLAVKEYQLKMKKRGERPYVGRKSRSNSLSRWTKQKWGYVNRDDVNKKRSKRGRYFPESTRKALSRKEKISTNRRKRAATKRGKLRSKYTKKEAKLVRNA